MQLLVDVITLFPQMFEALTFHGMTRRAIEKGLFQLQAWNPRDYAGDMRRTVDDRPFGGGPGMVMIPEPLEIALTRAKNKQCEKGIIPYAIYLSPQGVPLTHTKVIDLLARPGLVLLCGRYEGVDERVLQRQIDEEISIGDYVLSGGELPAMVLIDALIRQLPGVLNCPASVEQDSFVNGLLDCPHYTRPEVYGGMRVPTVLLSGNHHLIKRWRLKESLRRTYLRRPDLLERRQLLEEEVRLLAEFEAEKASTDT